ncbi:MAG: hypothetical protein ACRCTY_03230 [Candidatus Adiutrix sp.]
MPITISLSEENIQNHTPPECDEAANCSWFEKTIEADTVCANRHNCVCHKRCHDIFAPYKRPLPTVIRLNHDPSA